MTAKATYDGYGTSGWLTRVEPVITSKPFLCETPSPRHNPRLRSWLHHNIHKILLLAKPSKQCKKFSLLCIVLWGYSSLKPASHTNLCWDLTNFPHFICKRWPLASLLINQWDLLMSTCWSSMFADRNDWYDGEVSILSQRICRTCHNKRKKFEEKLDQAHWLFGGVRACAILTAILSPSTSPAMRARYCQASSSPPRHT